MPELSNEYDLKSFIAENIVSAGEAADILGCSRQYINQLVKEHKLIPVKKINYITLFLRSDIEALKNKK